MRGKGWAERGPKALSKNSDFGTPVIPKGRGGSEKGEEPEPLADEEVPRTKPFCPPTPLTRAAIYRSLRALRARNRKKVSKKVWRKVSKNTRKSL